MNFGLSVPNVEKLNRQPVYHLSLKERSAESVLRKGYLKMPEKDTRTLIKGVYCISLVDVFTINEICRETEKRAGQLGFTDVPIIIL